MYNTIDREKKHGLGIFSTTRTEEPKMSYRGHIKNCVVVLDDELTLPDGAEVTVDLCISRQIDAGEEDAPALYKRLEPVIETAKGLPSDLAENHDHYLHGRSKK